MSGIWLQRGIWYVVYDGPMPRNRVLFMLTAPLLSLSILPSLALPMLAYGFRCGLLYMVLIQASLCVGDLLTAGRIFRQVPAGGLVHNNGWTTYWRGGSDQRTA